MASNSECLDIGSSDWRKDWESSEDALWSAIKTTQFQRLFFKSKKFERPSVNWIDENTAYGDYENPSDVPYQKNLPSGPRAEPFPCTGLCGTDNYTRCPYCLIFRTKVDAPTDIFTLRDQMRQRKTLWECCCIFCGDAHGSDVVSANIWSFLMDSDLLFIPTPCFHGETFDHFFHQIQRRMNTRNMLLIHKSLREAPLKKRAEYYELSSNDECGDWGGWKREDQSRPRPLCGCCGPFLDRTDYSEFAEGPTEEDYFQVDSQTSHLVDFYDRAVQTMEKKWRTGIDGKKHIYRKKPSKGSKNARLKRGMHMVRST